MNINKLNIIHTTEWHGYQRHDFIFDGYSAFLVEPKEAAVDGRWSWCTVWPEAFVPRVGITVLLALGYHHVHIDVFATRANPTGVTVMHRFHDYLVSLGLAPKANLIGMSWGGFFSLRYAETYPQDVAAIYLDAPVCDAADPSQAAEDRTSSISEIWQMNTNEIRSSLLNPINNVTPIVDAKIPIYAATGEDDQVVSVWHNFNILEQKLLAAGAKPVVVRREAWGHHPHGFDDVTDIVRFHQAAH